MQGAHTGLNSAGLSRRSKMQRKKRKSKDGKVLGKNTFNLIMIRTFGVHS